MTITECPCRDCEERHATCHGKCKEYNLWRKEINNMKKRMEDKLTSNRLFAEEVANKKIKKMKRKGNL